MFQLSESFVASLARDLNSVQIPCVLWGHCLLGVHGVPTIIGSIDFVIPDDKLQAGENVLAQLKSLTTCTDPETCPSSASDRPTQPPAIHFHVGDASELTVGLYPQSDTLWFLPPLDDSLASPRSAILPEHFALASDRGVLPPKRLSRGSGAFQLRQVEVIVPRSHVLLEAFLRLYARDSRKRKGSFGMAMIAYMELYVDDDGYLDATRLPEPLRAFYSELREGSKSVGQWTDELREVLGMPDEAWEDVYSS